MFLDYIGLVKVLGHSIVDFDFMDFTMQSLLKGVY